MTSTETHPWGVFFPNGAKYLLLGSFTGKIFPGYDWFYSNKRNQFWPIIENVYGVSLETKAKKQELFRKLKIAVADIIRSCERKMGTNSDTNLVNIVYEVEGINRVLRKGHIKKIFFTSRFVETKFRRIFGGNTINLTTLPSPSPRFAKLSLGDKVRIYKKLLPGL